MKFLENCNLERIRSLLSTKTPATTDTYQLETRIESYSCKMVGQDKRLFKEFLPPGSTAKDLQALSPPVIEGAWAFPKNFSPSNISDPEMDSDDAPQLVDTISTVTLFNLIATLNACFPDYDFTDAKGHNFSKIPSLEYMKQSVDSKLAAIVNSFNQIKDGMWAIMNEEIKFKECVIYTYNPDYASDPYSEDGCTWSFNYFFYNRNLKRILFFTCRALSTRAMDSSNDEDSTDFQMDE